MKAKEIILAVTGSIAIYKSCQILRLFKKNGFLVSVVMTEEAKEFIRPLLFEQLSQGKVYSGLFTSPDVWNVEHVSLAKKADLVLVAPATANIIAKVNSGLCDDLLSCLIAATKAKVVFAPAMNETMYFNPITQENIKRLKTLGYKFISPKKGLLACGDEGMGCLEEPEEIFAQVKKILA